MNKILKFPTLLALVCVPLSSQAWWGPYGGNPYWGGYAPPVYAQPYPVAPYPVAPYPVAPYPTAPYYPNYGVPAYPMYGTNYYAPPPPPVQGPWGWGAADDNFEPPADMQATVKRSEAERKQAMQLSATRRAAFQDRMKAQRAAVKTQHEAWRQRMSQYATPEHVAANPQPMPQAQQPAEQQPTNPQPAPVPEATKATTPEATK